MLFFQYATWFYSNKNLAIVSILAIGHIKTYKNVVDIIAEKKMSQKLKKKIKS